MDFLNEFRNGKIIASDFIKRLGKLGLDNVELIYTNDKAESKNIKNFKKNKSKHFYRFTSGNNLFIFGATNLNLDFKHNLMRKAEVEPLIEPQPKEPITIPKPKKDPKTKPGKPSIDPFRRTPKIKPGEEPKPKAKHKYGFIKEMAIKYDRTNSRVHPDIARKLATDDHTFKNNPSLPGYEDPDGVIKNYPEYLSSKRFNELVSKLRHYLGDEDFDNINQMSMMEILMDSLMQTIEKEQTHRKKLEKLAEKLIKQLFPIPENSLQFDLKIVDLGRIDLSNVDKTPKDAEEEIEIGNDKEIFNLEKQKRRMINALIQGSANKGHYSFQLIRDELNKIDRDLVNLYGLMISSNDMNYWLMGDDMIKKFGEDNSAAGKSAIDMSTTPPTIHAEGINFPTLLHETIKGIMEYLSLHGLPGESNMRKAVLKKTDFLDSEMWDLRLGPEIWQKFLDVIGYKEMDIKHILYTEIIQMPAREFHKFMKELLSGSKKGKEKLAILANDIKDTLKDEKYREAMSKYRKRYGDKDIDPTDLFSKN